MNCASIKGVRNISLRNLFCASYGWIQP